MPETNNRKFKILGAAWLGLGGLAIALAFITLFPSPKATLLRQLKFQTGIGFSSRCFLCSEPLGWSTDWYSYVATR